MVPFAGTVHTRLPYNILLQDLLLSSTTLPVIVFHRLSASLALILENIAHPCTANSTGRKLGVTMSDERCYDVKASLGAAPSGHLALHGRDCGCVPFFSWPLVLFLSRDQNARELMETFLIKLVGQRTWVMLLFFSMTANSNISSLMRVMFGVFVPHSLPAFGYEFFSSSPFFVFSPFVLEIKKHQL